jgi:hypothetical protein
MGAKIAVPTEQQITNELRAIMARSDLDNLTCGDVCARESQMSLRVGRTQY